MEVTYGLMILIGLVTYIAWQRPGLHRKLMLNPYKTYRHRQYYRLITAGFVHNNSMHLFLNLLTLYFFGLAIEQIFGFYFGKLGPGLCLLLFFSAIIVANLPSLFKHRNDPGYNSLGASGGVSALVLAFILFDPLRDLCLYGLVCLPGYLLGGAFILYSIVMGRRGQDRINHDAHLYGALYGVVFTMIIKPEVLRAFLDAIF